MFHAWCGGLRYSNQIREKVRFAELKTPARRRFSIKYDCHGRDRTPENSAGFTASESDTVLTQILIDQETEQVMATFFRERQNARLQTVSRRAASAKTWKLQADPLGY